MPSSDTKTTSEEINLAYVAMCDARREFIEKYRAWLSALPAPGHVTDETRGSIGQIHGIYELWAGTVKP